MNKGTLKTIGMVVAIIVIINVAAYFWASRASASAPALAGDGGPTGGA